MILVHLSGGLGNQLFQYACGRALAERLGTELKLDLSWFEAQHLRQYGLGAFNIIENIATPREIEAAQTGVGFPGGIRSYLHWLKSSWHRFAEQKIFVYQQNVERIAGNKNVYLVGDWQSEKYFQEQTALIQREYSLKHPLSSEAVLLAEEMQRCQSVSIHIRRGDYVSDPKYIKTHNVCSLQYFQNAMQHFANTLDTPYFYIFSDDPAWCAQNLSGKYPIKLVSNDQYTAHDELVLRSFCQHHILSNSSFSWWGVWLNYSPDKRVIVPDQWLQGRKTVAQDIIPEQWQVTILTGGEGT